MEFYIAYKDGMIIKISRPDYLTGRDKEISTRAFELLKGGFKASTWSKEMDKLFADNFIMYKQVPQEVFNAYLKSEGGKRVVPGHLER